MKGLFPYKGAEETSPLPPEGVRMTQSEWESLTPGYRRAITRDFAPKKMPEVMADEGIERRNRKEDVEYAGSKRL